MNNSKPFWVFVLIFVSRLPFIFSGYGAEEDAWGLAVNAYKMAQTGVYEVSRLPGHPLQEYVYAWLPVKEVWIFNLFTAAISTVGLFLFYRILKKLAVPNSLLATVALAFVPVYFINCTNAMDYTWTMAFVFASLLCVLNNKNIAAGFFIACAVACRITAGGFLLPLVYFVFINGATADAGNGIQKKNFEPALKVIFATLFFTLLFFIPVFKNYGGHFFGFTNQFGYPPLVKTIYKSTVGVFGLLGFVTIVFVIWKVISRLVKEKIISEKINIFRFCLLAISVFLFAFLIEPHKSAYLIPVLPFVIMLFAIFLEKKQMLVLAAVFILNCFFFGVNLADDYRSAAPSSLSITKNISGQKVSFDFLKGPVIDDYEKRLQRIKFADEVVNKLSSRKEKTFVIAGYWLNYILIEQRGKENINVELCYYADKNTLTEKQRHGYTLFYLPEQDKWNDKCFKEEFTKGFAKTLIEE